MTRDRHRAERRLRQFQRSARARLALDGPQIDPRRVPDADRLAAPFLERIGARERVQLLLWASMALVLAFSLVSFFSAPLMGVDLAMSALVVGMMLILSYVM
jgi:hypothetical protein